MRLCVIFDMDGVLVDSYKAHLQSWQMMAGEFGESLTEAQFLETFGQTSREIIARHWGVNKLSPEQIELFDHRKEALYRGLIERDFPEMPGARDLIENLRAARFKLAVGSSGPPENVDFVLRRMKIRRHFEVRVTGRDVTHGKPNPEVFLTAAQKLKTDPLLCAVIEDAPVGIAAANAAGMTSIALLSTGHTAEKSAAAQVIVRKLTDLSADRIAALIGSAAARAG
ncbi:MAG: HAD family hydrolase [Planctomycetaceae bacterium]